MLLDSASLYFRAFYGVPESITAPDGTPVNAVRGFSDMVSRLVTERRPGRLVACLDLDWRPAFRVQALPSYKAHRVAGEPGDGAGRGARGGAGHARPAGAGDPRRAGRGRAGHRRRRGPRGRRRDRHAVPRPSAPTRCAVVSGDRDLMQVVRDEPTPVRLVYVGRGLAKAETSGRRRSPRSTGCPRPGPARRTRRWRCCAATRRDGLPGVPGIGAKTAATLVGRFASWAELRAAVVDRTDTRLSPPVRSKLAAAAPYLAVVEPVVRVALDAPVRMGRPDVVPGRARGPRAAGRAGAAVGAGWDGGAAGRGAGGRGKRPSALLSPRAVRGTAASGRRPSEERHARAVGGSGTRASEVGAAPRARRSVANSASARRQRGRVVRGPPAGGGERRTGARSPR